MIFPREITWREGMDVKALVTTLNEWTRDANAAIRRELDFAQRLKPTSVIVDSYHAKPWDCVIVDASKRAMDVHLPRAKEARAKMVGVINVSASENVITIRPAAPTDKINGQSTHTIAEGHGHRFLYSTGEDWYTLGPRVSDDGGAIYPPGAGSLLWEWNGLDISQFEAADAFNSGFTTSFSAVANADVPGGNVLRYGWVSGGGPWQAVRLIKASELVFPLRYVVSVEYLSGSRQHGWVFYGDMTPGSLYAYGFEFAVAWKVTRYDGASAVAHANNATRVIETVSSLAGRATLTIAGDKIASTEPRWHAAATGTVQGGDIDQRNIEARHTDVPSRPVGATWQTVDPTRAGLSLANWQTGTTGTADIAAIRIFKHPRDL